MCECNASLDSILIIHWSWCQGPATQHLVFEVHLCHAVGLTHRLSNCSRVSANSVIRWVDKTLQEAGSWALSPVLVASSSSRWHYFNFFFIWLLMFSGLSKHTTLWELWKSPELRVLALKSQEQPSCDRCPLCMLLTLWWCHGKKIIMVAIKVLSGCL